MTSIQVPSIDEGGKHSQTVTAPMPANATWHGLLEWQDLTGRTPQPDPTWRHPKPAIADLEDDMAADMARREW